MHPHTISHRLAATEDRFVAVGRAIVFDLGQQLGVAEPELIATNLTSRSLPGSNRIVDELSGEDIGKRERLEAHLVV